MDYKNIIATISDGKARITINRPQVKNALDLATWEELYHFIQEIHSNNTVCVLIITGVGEEAFAAGSDIKYLLTRSVLETLEGYSQHVLRALEELPMPTIAAVNGYALGGGCELALACDLRIASDRAKLGQPEVGLGILPGAGGTQRLTALIGVAKAKELIFTGEIVDATTAKQFGLVNQVVPHEMLGDHVDQLAHRIMQKGPLAVRLAKQAIMAGVNYGHAAGYEVERMAQAILFSTEDHLEGIRAAIEKRRPTFTGE